MSDKQVFGDNHLCKHSQVYHVCMHCKLDTLAAQAATLREALEEIFMAEKSLDVHWRDYATWLQLKAEQALSQTTESVEGGEVEGWNHIR